MVGLEGCEEGQGIGLGGGEGQGFEIRELFKELYGSMVEYRYWSVVRVMEVM